MYLIEEAKQLNQNNYLMVVRAPEIARHCLPGQFLIVRADEKGERIPLTICDYDAEKGTITIVFQPIGVTTMKMATYGAGDSFADVVGPLGRPSDLCEMTDEELKDKHFLFVAGGVGAAPIYPQVKYLAQRGLRADVVNGAKTKELVLFEKEMSEYANVYVTTDDGSYGFHGMVTAMMEELVTNRGMHYDRVIAIGPMIMMKFAALTAKKLGIPSVVSMNPIMVDGTGMCGACRVTVGGKTKFACVDGPEFPGDELDFDEAMQRSRMYRTEEGRAILRYREGNTHHGGCGQCEDGGTGR
ncbi:MAG: sulfide/dihydroorotate dehydrogenase-like FAD/NAD-binding protein [Lachnospiraceae bacterium]|nr:sulfide/dihydroorotate dehydrogenase-like FAD/NAD-binding protein [Lachnospiraceae bacterium]